MRGERESRRYTVAAMLALLTLSVAALTAVDGCGGSRNGTSPSPTPTPTPVSTPTATPTPAPTSTPTPTPVPTAIPTASPSPFTGRLTSDYFVVVPAGSLLHRQTVDAYTYTDDFEPVTQTTTSESDGTVGFSNETLTDVIPVNLPDVGKVNQRTLYDTSGSLSRYDYWKTDDTGYYRYGSDDYLRNAQGKPVLSSTTRYAAGLHIPTGLTPGQTVTEDVQITRSFYDTTTGALTSTYTEPYHFTVTLAGFETITIPAGVFPNAAKIVVHGTYTHTDSSAITLTQTDDETYWTVPALGGIQSQTKADISDVNRDGISLGMTPTSDNAITTLQYARVNGVAYGTIPAGKAAQSRRK